jgi:hypothetical protein
VIVPVLSNTTASTPASCSSARPLRITTPAWAALVIAASTAVGTETRIPVAKSVMRMEAARVGLRVAASTVAASRKDGSTSRSASLPA